LVGKHGSENLNWDSSPPARINFTALPAVVWNRFTLFIRHQGGHAAGSVDSTLNLMSRLICDFAIMETFHYSYDNRHWENQKKAKGNLEKLALEDGWENLASEEIQLLNRRLDAFSALIFFQDLMPIRVDRVRLSLLGEFKLSFKKRLHLRLRILFYLFLGNHYLPRYVKSVDSEKLKQQTLIRNRLKIDKLILLSTKVRTQQDLLKLTKLIKSLGNFPLLRDRFVFWESTFQRKM
jgi:hypothetical protein